MRPSDINRSEAELIACIKAGHPIPAGIYHVTKPIDVNEYEVIRTALHVDMAKPIIPWVGPVRGADE